MMMQPWGASQIFDSRASGPGFGLWGYLGSSSPGPDDFHIVRNLLLASCRSQGSSYNLLEYAFVQNSLRPSTLP